MTIKHHPKAETLAAYAAGSLDEACSVVVATHLGACRECRLAVEDFESLGGVCFEGIDAVPLSDGALQRFWDLAGPQRTAPEPAPGPARDRAPEAAPALARYLSGGVDAIAWRPVAPGVSQHVLDAEGYRPGALRIVKIAPGVRLLRHTHRGGELTLILRGGYRDEIGEFGPGDLADLDGEETHSPAVMGDEACICLIATSAPLAFKGLVGRVAQPFVGL